LLAGQYNQVSMDCSEAAITRVSSGVVPWRYLLNPAVLRKAIMTTKSLALLAFATLALYVHVQKCLSQDRAKPNDTTVLYKALIEELVSPNTKPETHINGKPHRVHFPADYDVKSQERVDDARRALDRGIAEALPYLIDALDDKRYSMTINWGDRSTSKRKWQICPRRPRTRAQEIARDAK
jgi:hypothetical protein